MTDLTQMAASGLRRLDRDGTIEVEREQPVVCIPIFGAHELFVSCLRSVLEHTPAEVPILVADDASLDPASASFLEELDADGILRHRIYYSRRERNIGFVENVNAAFNASEPGDVVVLNSDCEVGPRWLELLRAAAYSDSTVATASALTNNGSILSVPERNRPQPRLPSNLSVDAAARAVTEHSLRIRPRIPTAIGHCVYFRRSALDLVGSFDTAFSPGYGEEVDFSQRCVLRGLVHVAADDVFVFHHGAGTFGKSTLKEEHERLIADRYPYYHPAVDAVARTASGALPRALLQARRGIEGLTVTVDARCLGPAITGTQIHVLELTHAIARSQRVASLRVLVPPDMSPWFRASLARIQDLEIIRSDQITPRTARTLVVHRPYQVFDVADLEAIVGLGERFLVTHQDLISYHNPGYSKTFWDWDAFRRVTRTTLAVADRVLFFSQHAADQAVAGGLVEPSRVSVALLGVDHSAAMKPPVPERPRSLPDRLGDGFLLCLGTNFRHKNRVFALQLLAELNRRQAWDGHLVFAGPHAACGTSEADEAAFVARNPDVAARTVDLHGVTEAEKAWLLREAKGVVYPTVYEGFGLVPFEAADHGTPCFFAAQTAVGETLPTSTAIIVQWDAARTADRVYPLLRDEDAARELVERVRTAGAPLTWDGTATKVVDAYEHAVADRDRDADLIAGGDGVLATRIAMRSLEEGLELPEEVSRAIRAFAASPTLRKPFFRTLLAAFRAGYVFKHHRMP